jgi:SAM-dependent methyltransferase
LDLGLQPICNAFLTAKKLSLPEEKYPLKLVLCKECRLVQLQEKIPAQTVFGPDYNYLYGSSTSLLSYFRNFAQTAVKRFKLAGSNICDIGSNDGSLLRFFKQNGCTVVGVEPTPLPANQANSNGITTVQAYFTNQIAKSLVTNFGHMRFVTAMNVIAHTNEIQSFIAGVRQLLEPEGVFVSQSHYLPLLMERSEYDTIYHEHLRYYTLRTIRKLFARCGFHVFDAETNDVYGGSIVVYASRTNRKPSQSIAKLLKDESAFQRLEAYEKFGKNAEENAKQLSTLLNKLKNRGKKIVGIGAPMKSSTLLNYCGLGPDLIDYLTEVNTLKIGTFSPGVHIPVVAENRMFENPPDYALVLSWNMADDIMGKLRGRGYAGKFIIPVPKPRVV